MTRLRRAAPADREATTRALVTALEGEPRVAYAYLHGSFLDQPGFRDIDVAICTVDDSEASQLALALASSLSDRVGLPVDVRPLNGAPLSFRFHVFRGRLLVSRDDERLADAIEDTTRRYLDIEPILRRATREAFAA